MKNEELVQRFVDQELSAEERLRFVARLGRDEALRRQAIELEQLVLDTSRLPRPALPDGFVGRVMERELGSGLRVLGIRVLGNTKSPQVLEALIRLTSGGRTWWGGKMLAPKSPELLAVLSELAKGWGADARAQGVLARALKSKDAEIRTAATAGTGRP